MGHLVKFLEQSTQQETWPQGMNTIFASLFFHILHFFSSGSSRTGPCMRGSPLLKKKTTTRLGQFRESTDY